jgi:hypothetical protein
VAADLALYGLWKGVTLCSALERLKIRPHQGSLFKTSSPAKIGSLLLSKRRRNGQRDGQKVREQFRRLLERAQNSAFY